MMVMCEARDIEGCDRRASRLSSAALHIKLDITSIE